jgi:flagellar assembly protein FliH
MVLGTELSDPARAAAHAVRRAVAEVPVEQWTRVVLSEQDARTVHDDDALSEVVSGVEVIGSPSVDAGGALVEIEDGAIDTRIREALRRVHAALEGKADQGEEIVR